jgi:hypothetical protein
MSYSDEIAKKEQSINIVAKIGDEYYAKTQVDSGLVIPEENLILDDVSINGTTLDIRQVNTPVGSTNFKLKDENEYITIKIMQDPNNFLEKKVEVYVGFKTGAFDFSDYKKVANTTINSVTKIANGYSIKSKEVTSLLDNPVFNTTNKLAIDILSISTSLTLESAQEFPNEGLLRLNNEFIRYNGKTDNVLENLTRGQVGTIADGHSIGDEVYLVTELIASNPIDLILQILLSNTGDGTNGIYDALPRGLNIDPSFVNITSLEEIRDQFFTGEQFTLYAFNEVNTLKFLENELLKATNTRLFSDDGLITMSILDQVDAGADVLELNEDSIVGTPTWTLGSDKIINVVKFNWDYDDASRTYLETTTVRDQESIDFFGEKKPLVFNFKGVKASLNGGTIINDRSIRILSRLSTPRGKITCRTHLDVSEISVGQNILLSHRFLPKQGAGLGINDQLEVMSKKVDFRRGEIQFSLEYTSFTGIRVPFIAPSPLIVNVIDQRTIEVPDAPCYRIGHAIRIFEDGVGFYPDPINLIEDINGNIITLVRDFTTPLTTAIRIKLAPYLEASRDQTNRYAFIGNNGANFEDGTKSYQILF